MMRYDAITARYTQTVYSGTSFKNEITFAIITLNQDSLVMTMIFECRYKRDTQAWQGCTGMGSSESVAENDIEDKPA